MATWREFTSWRCEACGDENIIVEREERSLGTPGTFDRRCEACGRVAGGRTIRPAGVAYRITTAREFYGTRRSARSSPPPS